MDIPISNLDFRGMAFAFKLRDFFRPPMNVLKEVGIESGFQVLDFGCGPGSYVAGTAELVNKSGKVYALDIHPLAVQMVQRMASEKQLTNVETIRSDCKTGLPNDSMNVVLLYDVFHDLNDQMGVLQELHRVLKPNGILSFSDHHLKEYEIISKLTSGGLFRLSRKGEKTYTFVKI